MILDGEIRKKVLREISPSIEEIEQQRTAIAHLKSAIEEYAHIKGFQYSFVQPQGSTGIKQTQLRGASDIDLFVALDPEDYRNILEMPKKQRDGILGSQFESFVVNWFMPALKNISAEDLKKAYSQHPYLSAKYMGLDVDVLVCFDMSAEIIMEKGPITAVDRTIHHSRFVAEHIDNVMREDIRILKSFVQACHAYGDKCAVGQMGFTGVSLELIVISEKSFEEAIKRILILDKKPLDPLSRGIEELRAIEQFKDDIIFIIDPTDTRRNIASSFSKRSVNWVKSRASRLLSNDLDEAQILDLIIEKPIPTASPPDWFMKHCFVFEVLADERKHYTVNRDKLYRVCRRMTKELETERTGEPRFGRTTFEVVIENSRYGVGFLVESPIISETYPRRGPPLDSLGCEKFKERHKHVFSRNGYLWAEVKRNCTDASKMTEYLLKEFLPEGFSLKIPPAKAAWQAANILYHVVYPLEKFPINERNSQAMERESDDD